MSTMRHLRLLFLAPLLLAACQGDELTPLGLEADLQVSPARVSFGLVPIGATESRQLLLDNEGQLPLRLEARIEHGRAGVFTPSQWELSVDVGQRVRVAVTFAPDLPEAMQTTLLLVDPDSGERHAVVQLTGRGETPDCEDQNPCTDDLFDFERRACTHPHREGSCDDNLRCTEGDRCFQGRCLGAPILCDDGIDCTIDACREDRGCAATPDHRRCASDQLCRAGRCDAELGCVVELAPDGSSCGAFSCAQLALCFQGQCRRERAPDGIPCDDGDPCTAGDACQAGLCASGTDQGFAVSTPIDFDPHHPLSSSWPRNPVAVLAVNAPAAGGLDTVWLEGPGVGEAQHEVLRSLVDADGALISTVTLALATQAQAAFYNDELYLLLVGCTSCGSCQLGLRRHSVDDTVVISTCLDQMGLAPAEVALAVDAGGVYVAQVDEPAAPPVEELCYDCYATELPAAVAARCQGLD